MRVGVATPTCDGHPDPALCNRVGRPVRSQRAPKKRPPKGTANGAPKGCSGAQHKRDAGI
jgi:hypothetical protein